MWCNCIQFIEVNNEGRTRKQRWWEYLSSWEISIWTSCCKCLQGYYRRYRPAVTGRQVSVFNNFLAISKMKYDFYTCVPSFSVLPSALDLTSPCLTTHAKCSLTHFQKLIIVQMRLRLNLSIQDLALVSMFPNQLSRTFKIVIAMMYDHLLCGLIENLWYITPMVFRRHFGLRVYSHYWLFQSFLWETVWICPKRTDMVVLQTLPYCKILDRSNTTGHSIISITFMGWKGQWQIHYCNFSLLDTLLLADLLLPDGGIF